MPPMPDPTEPRLVEAVPVTLMRIEGMVGGVAKDIAHVIERVGDLRTEVVEHRGKIGALESSMQQVRSDQATAAKDLVAADKAREDTAAALEKQTAAQVLKAKDAVDAASARWVPRNFFIALGGLVVAILAVYIAFKFGSSSVPTVR